MDLASGAETAVSDVRSSIPKPRSGRHSNAGKLGQKRSRQRRAGAPRTKRHARRIVLQVEGQPLGCEAGGRELGHEFRFAVAGDAELRPQPAIAGKDSAAHADDRRDEKAVLGVLWPFLPRGLWLLPGLRLVVVEDRFRKWTRRWFEKSTMNSIGAA